MKNLVIFLVLLVFATSSEVALGQTRQDRAYIAVIDDQISDLESELKALKKDFKKEKKEEIYDLKNKLREAERLANQKPGVVARSIAEVNQAKQDVEFYREQIKEAEAVITNLPIGLLERDLAELKEEKRNYRYSISESDRIPREMSYSTKNRRQRSNVIRREELVLAKVEKNLEYIYNPVTLRKDSHMQYESSVGITRDYAYQEVDESVNIIILDNQYSRQAEFVLTGLNGGEEIPIAVPPRTMYEYKNIVPDNYIVEYYVAGRKLEKTTRIDVDGRIKVYNGRDCVGYAYISRY